MTVTLEGQVHKARETSGILNVIGFMFTECGLLFHRSRLDSKENTVTCGECAK